MHFGFLIFPGVEELDLIGPWEMGTMWRTYANGPECLTVSETGGPTVCAKGLKIAADVAFDACPDLDYLLVPGGFAALEEARNEHLLSFVAAQAKRCRHVLSVCTGSFILQAAGLLHGRRATTHWKFLKALRDIPEITVVEDRYVQDGNVWTSGGVSAGIDLVLALIAEEAGSEAAATVQYNAEYFPDGKVYGTVHQGPKSAAYFRHLVPTN